MVAKKITKPSAKNSHISGRFQPGQSGNPAGRPVGSKNRFSALKEHSWKRSMGLAALIVLRSGLRTILTSFTL